MHTIIKRNIATINHNQGDTMVSLSIAIDNDNRYYIVTGSNEDTEYRFDSLDTAIAAISQLWGDSTWGLTIN